MSARPAPTELSLGQFFRAERARRERESQAPAAGGETLERLLAEFSHTTDAACLLRADVELPPEHYAFLDALIGVSGGSAEWFDATDARVAKRAGRSTKWVQRSRKALDEWQHARNFQLVDVADHYTGADLKRHPHRYRLHLHRLAVETRLEAESSPHWQDPRRRGYALQAAARRTRDSIPEWAPRQRRGRRREPDAATIINSSLKVAATKIEKAVAQLAGVELRRLASGFGPGVSVEPEVVARLRAALDDLGDVLGGLPGPGEVPAAEGAGGAKNHFRPINSLVDIMSTRPRGGAPDELGERAAVLEYDGGMSREEAERLAFGGGDPTCQSP